MEHFCRLVPLRFPSGASFHRRFIVSPSLQLYSARLSWQVPNLCLSVTQLSISAINRDSMQTALRNAILDILFTHVFHVKHCDQAVVWQYTSVWWQPDTDPWPALVSSVNCCQWTQPVSTLWASLLLSTLAAFKAVFGLQQPTHTHTHTPPCTANTLILHSIKDNIHSGLDPHQYAFRTDRATDVIPTALHSVSIHLENENSYIRMLFVSEFGSTFNTVWPMKLIGKLDTLGLSACSATGYRTSSQANPREFRLADTPLC